MPCYHPLSAFQSDARADGKTSISFKGDSGGRPISLPCGRCIGCRLERSRQWACRMMHEASLHERNCFLTLTFDQDNCPADYSLNVVTVQKFLKRYRKRCGKFRFFNAGEYGEKNFRPHYHLCIFGHDFSDKIPCKVDTGKDMEWVSPTLLELWPFGDHRIGTLTFESAAYVARYVTSKITGELAEDHYTRVIQSTGEIVNVEPEFATMSRRPGIGTGWYDKYQHNVFPLDRVVQRGIASKPPRAYEKLLEKRNPELYAKLKASRIEKFNLRDDESVLESLRRLESREEFARLKQKTFSKRNGDF